MTRKLTLFDFGCILSIFLIPFATGIDAYRGMIEETAHHDGGTIDTQTAALLFQESLSNTANSMGGVVGIGLSALLMMILFRAGSKDFEKPMFREPYFWLRFSFLLVWLFLLPLADIAGNYFAVWHPLREDAFHRFQFVERGWVLASVVVIVAGLLQSSLRKSMIPSQQVAARPE